MRAEGAVLDYGCEGLVIGDGVRRGRSLPWMMKIRGMVGLHDRVVRVKRSEHMSTTAWESMGNRCDGGDGDDDDGEDGRAGGDDDDVGSKTSCKHTNSSLTTASVMVCGVVSAGSGRVAATNSSNVAEVSSIAKRSVRGRIGSLQDIVNEGLIGTVRAVNEAAVLLFKSMRG